MMEIKLYKSYGVLAHEEHPVYSYGVPASNIYDVVNVEIPDSITICDSVMDDKLVDIDGMTFLLREVLRNWGDKPALIYPTKYNKMKRIILKEKDMD